MSSKFFDWCKTFMVGFFVLVLSGAGVMFLTTVSLLLLEIVARVQFERETNRLILQNAGIGFLILSWCYFVGLWLRQKTSI